MYCSSCSKKEVCGDRLDFRLNVCMPEQVLDFRSFRAVVSHRASFSDILGCHVCK